MTTTYSKSISASLPGGHKPGQLYREIIAVLTTLISIDTDGADTINFVFSSSLSGGEQTTLNSLIAAHVPNYAKPRNNFFTIIPKNNSIKASSYVVCGLFKYIAGITINYIEIISYINTTMTSYSVRVMDKKNNLLIAERTGLTNTISDSIDLGTIYNTPEGDSIFELQVKTVGATGSNNVVVENLIVYY